jgi:uroporphyrinogen-III decarboxylase
MDVVQAKQILNGHTCVMGNVPKSLRYTSSREVLRYYRELIKKCGSGGGLMLNISFPYNCSVDELKDMVRRIKEYAVC